MRVKLQSTTPVAAILVLVTGMSMLWAVSGCGQPKRAVAFQDLVQGADSSYGAEGAPAPALLVITDQQTLAAFSSEFIPNTQGQLAGIDFSRDFIIATLQGSKPTGGYAILVSSISQQNADVFVQVALVEPAPGAVLTQVITGPYDVVRVSRADLNPRGSLTFHMIGEDGQALAERQADI